MAVKKDTRAFDWLGLAEAAEQVGIDYQTFAYQMREGNFPVRQIGKTYLVHKDIIADRKAIEVGRANARTTQDKRRAVIQESMPPGLKVKDDPIIAKTLGKGIHPLFVRRMELVESGELGITPEPISESALKEAEDEEAA